MHADSQRFVILQSVDSTNNYAMAEVHAGMAKHGQSYFAHRQIAGKGQRGKRWYSGDGENIVLSMVLEPIRFAALPRFLLSALIATSCCQLVADIVPKKTRIKWPNDIYIGDRKAGGILIENLVKGNDWLFAVAGIGLNVNQTAFSPSLPNPVSLKTETGKDFNVIDLAQCLSAGIVDKLQSAVGEEIIEEYNRLLYKAGEMVTLKKNNVIFQARVIGVSEQGRLIVHHGFEQQFDWGDIEWKINGT